MVIFSLVFLVIAFIVRGAAGSPFRVISYCNLRSVIPPVWLMVILWVAWYIVLGGVFGSVLFGHVCRDEVAKYKGGMLFMLMMALGYLWYPIFFGAAALLFALFVAEAVLALAFLSAIYFFRVRKGAGWIMLGFSLWMIYMVLLNIMCLFAR